MNLSIVTRNVKKKKRKIGTFRRSSNFGGRFYGIVINEFFSKSWTWIRPLWNTSIFAFRPDETWVKVVGIDISTKPAHTLMKKFLRCCRSISLTVTDNAADIHSAWRWNGNCLLSIIISGEVISPRIGRLTSDERRKVNTLRSTYFRHTIEGTIALESKTHVGINFILYSIIYFDGRQ